ncbi:MAG: tetratricopeptide repeat protein [Candidatus Omnitrophota bacterium]
MCTRILNLLLLTVFILAIVINVADDSFAFWGSEGAEREPGSSASQVIKVTNERLNKRVEELSKENDQFKSDLAKLQGDIYSTKRDRDQLLDKLKIIAQENNKLKEQITYLDAGLIKVDGIRNDAEKENKVLQEKIAQLESKLAAFIQAESAVNDANTAIISSGQKSSTALKKASPLEQAKFELEQYKKKTRELEKSLRAALDQEAISARKNLHDKKESSQKQTKLKNTVTRLTKNTLIQKEAITKLETLLEETKVKLFDTAKELESYRKDAIALHYNMGVILQGQAQWEAAIGEYQKVVALKPNDADAHFNLALIYDTIQNERAKANEHYRKYLDIKPDAPDAAKVKERMTHLNTESGIWGDPNAKGIGEKLGRW